MRTLIGAAAVWLLCVSVVSPGQAEEFTGGGPLPVRNFQPIQLIFLNLPFERAQVLAPAEFELHFDSAESNEIATNQEDVQALLKFETNRTVLGGSVGVLRGLEVGLDVPFISRFGGFLETADGTGTRPSKVRQQASRGAFLLINFLLLVD